MTNAAQPLDSDAVNTEPPAGAPVPPQLRRSGTDRMAGGVCGGLAEYSGIDVVLWRVAFVALTLAGGAGVIAYLLLWVLLPSGPLAPGEEPSPLEKGIDRLRTAITGALSGRAR
jgi:phage shock protein PspC (stress-responsive transcriptional regulator)